MNTFEFEKKMQTLADTFYRQRGLQVDRSGACKKFDCIISRADMPGVTQKIEEKFNRVEYPYKNGLIEIVQDMESADLGWYFETGCEFLHWFECTEVDGEYRLSVLYRLKWDDFKKWFNTNLLITRPKVVKQHYGLTFNLTFPWDKCIKEVETCKKYPVPQFAPLTPPFTPPRKKDAA